jgi:hypothetical protein
MHRIGVEVSMQTTSNSRDLNDEKHRTGGRATRMIEKTTASIPSGTFLVLAGGAAAGSLALKLMGRNETANFVGEWVPAILMLGLYNKMAKLLGGHRGELTRT